MASLQICPHCNAKHRADGLRIAGPIVSWPSGSARLTPLQAKLLDVLARVPGLVPAERIVSQLYAHDPDGGPLNEAGALRWHVFDMRRRLRAANAPIAIKSHHGLGYELAA